MTRPMAKGWCPGVLKPMMSGDGLLVRVRPRLGRLTRPQVEALCGAALAHGNGVLDLTSRANVQLRGIQPAGYEPLLAELATADLIDNTVADETRDNVIVSPFWQTGDDTAGIASELRARLDALPELPAKFGFAIDVSGPGCLAAASADVRLERSAEGALLVRRDGAEFGERTTREEAVDRMIELCDWFVATGGRASRRMARHRATPPVLDPLRRERPAAPRAPLVPGMSSLGPVYGAPFGSVEATDLLDLVRASDAAALRTTPWRLFVLEGGAPVDCDALITTADDPLLHVAACPGAPRCPSATVDTRTLARALAPVLAGRVEGSLHVSGCAKGCAHPKNAAISVVGREDRFDIVRNGCAWDAPEASGLQPAEIVTQLGSV